MDGRSIPRRLLPPSLLDQKEGWSNGEKLHKNDMSITALLEFGAEAAALSTQRSLNAGLGGHITATICAEHIPDGYLANDRAEAT